jgi:hypothetical protein
MPLLNRNFDAEAPDAQQTAARTTKRYPVRLLFRYKSAFTAKGLILRVAWFAFCFGAR